MPKSHFSLYIIVIALLAVSLSCRPLAADKAPEIVDSQAFFLSLHRSSDCPGRQ